jgi:hypothetical protein
VCRPELCPSMTPVPTYETFCVDCGALNSTARGRCRDCGASLHPSAPRPAPPPGPAVPSTDAAPTETEMFCAACGVLNSTSRNRCRECGAPLRPSAPRPAPPPGPAVPSTDAAPTETEIFCAACGVLNSTSRNRCRECGAPLRPVAPSAAPSPDAAVYGAALGDDEVVCRGCRRISPAETELCAGCGRRLRLPRPVAPPPAAGGPIRVCPRCRRGNPGSATFCHDCGGALVRGSVGYAPAPELPVVVPSVVGLCCPACGTTMEAGEAGLGVNYRRLATWFVGSSWLELFFRRAGDRHPEWLMRPGPPSSAARCTGCGGVWLSLPPTRPDGTAR